MRSRHAWIAELAYVLVAMVGKRFNLDTSLYTLRAIHRLLFSRDALAADILGQWCLLLGSMESIS
jgi:hypothetical protein